MKGTRLLAIVLLASVLALVASAQPVVLAALNGASYSAVVSPGCLVTILGANYAAASVRAQSVPLPNALGGVLVSVGGLPAPLLSVSPNQVNALIPLEVAIPANTVVPLAITAPGGSSSFNIRLTRNAPSIFSQDGTGTGPALLFDGSSTRSARFDRRTSSFCTPPGSAPLTVRAAW